MATEPLGQRILGAANAYAAAISEQVVAISRGTWEVAHADAVTDAMDRLRSLVALADAAERGMVASSRYIATIDGQRAWTTGTDSDLSEALAAWRAINGEVDG